MRTQKKGIFVPSADVASPWNASLPAASNMAGSALMTSAFSTPAAPAAASASASVDGSRYVDVRRKYAFDSSASTGDADTPRIIGAASLPASRHVVFPPASTGSPWYAGSRPRTPTASASCEDVLPIE